MKLEVGMYVRTPKGIAKITSMSYINKDVTFEYYLDNKRKLQADYFAKASHNITDLLELNDLVEIKESIDCFSKSYFIGIDEMATLRTIIEKIENNSLILKGILTHEQYKKYSYKADE